ncbi:MAG: NAD(P)(+) transhydrogenase (Re/Si-specific) subunit beta [Planctomycetota bacterium]
MSREHLIDIAFLVAIVLFIFGIKRLGKVKTARSGNTFAWLAMLVAILAALASAESFVVNWAWIAAAGVAGAVVGAIAARMVAMTEMPEMVALFNGSGGIASLLVALAALWGWNGSGLAHDQAKLNDAILQPQHMALVLHEFSEDARNSETLGTPEEIDAAIALATKEEPEIKDSKGPSTSLGLVLSILIGGITLSGSFVAYGKLSGKMNGNAIVFPGQHAINALLLLLSFAICGWMAFGATATAVGPLSYLEWLAIALTVLSLVLGVTLVIPIGGADMPVVISLLNSYSGLAASMTGFVLQNTLLIVSGAMVGAAGLILTAIMCKAMNRSLLSVLMGGFGATSSEAAAGDARDYKNIKKTTADELAMMLDGVTSVVFVPGYGLAVAQAQHVTRELSDFLASRDVEVTYAIHPVAGRMPGHMNVLLAEANVPYEQLVEMDQINPKFKTTDLSIILGANDVVNPAALDEPDSPLAGMPILNVHESANVVVIKRSLSPGYAGVKNKLFERDNTLMLFGDAKDALQECLEELKNA